jgi:hypothetical protein
MLEVKKANITEKKYDLEKENFEVEKHDINRKFKCHMTSFYIMVSLYCFYNLPMASCSMLV